MVSIRHLSPILTYPRVTTVAETLDSCIDLIRQCRVDKKPISIGFYGNIVDLWERLVEEHKKSVENGYKLPTSMDLLCQNSGVVSRAWI